jgi:hypothetical protein
MENSAIRTKGAASANGIEPGRYRERGAFAQAQSPVRLLARPAAPSGIAPGGEPFAGPGREGPLAPGASRGSARERKESSPFFVY